MASEVGPRPPTSSAPFASSRASWTTTAAVRSGAGYVAYAEQSDRWESRTIETLIAALNEGDVFAHGETPVIGG